MAIEYVVRIECATEEHRGRMEHWLLGSGAGGGHFADVLASGARTASLARFDDAPLTVEARYRFASRDAFAVYERDHAPRLRAEGRALFPDGVRFERRLGEVLGDRE
jgi:hypothetical protein